VLDLDAGGLGPASSIQHPTPSTQHPAPSIQHPAPSIQHPAPSTQHPAPSTQHPAPSTQHPAPAPVPGSRSSIQHSPLSGTSSTHHSAAPAALTTQRHQQHSPLSGTSSTHHSAEPPVASLTTPPSPENIGLRLLTPSRSNRSASQRTARPEPSSRRRSGVRFVSARAIRRPRRLHSHR